MSVALSLVPEGPLPARHLTREEFGAILDGRGMAPVTRRSYIRAWEDFTARWPDLEVWRQQDLPTRLNHPPPDRGSYAKALLAAERFYLCCAALHTGLVLDYDWLLGHTFHEMGDKSGHLLGMGADWLQPLFDAATQAGYADKARQATQFATVRIALHRGDTDWRNITARDIAEFRAAVKAFCSRPDVAQLRQGFRTGGATVRGWRRTTLNHAFTLHAVMNHMGLISEPPSLERQVQQPVTGGAPAINATIERYVATVAHTSPSTTVADVRAKLRMLVEFLSTRHPEILSLRELTRPVMEEWLEWLPARVSTRTGNTLSVNHRVSTVSVANVFLRRTAEWEWDDVPERPLLSSADIPKRVAPLPRFIPDEQLPKIHKAICELTDPYAKAALLVARWVGPRRSEIRRLDLDCLDTYQDGYPRLRIPAGKTYTERSVPLHPEAAEALRAAMDLTIARQWKGTVIDKVTGLPVRPVFRSRSGLMSTYALFDRPLQMACEAAELVDETGHRIVTSHRFRHSVGTALAEAGARTQTIMSILGHASASMSMVYAHISDPTVRKDYEKALASGASLAGPALDAVMKNDLSDDALNWLQTNYYKTALELGHCLRLPEEGPCECDLYLNCGKFLTTSEYAPRMRAKIRVEERLAQDADARGWGREVERHEAIGRRLKGLLDELGEPHEGPEESCDRS